MTQALIPLYCMTGFVGSGKTTVLLSILKQYPQKKIGVIFTEPAAYIKESDDISIECLESGSLKCTCEEEALPQALTYMRQCQPEMVFVEISGLSDPIHIKKILEKEENANALRRYDIQGIICLVDADNFMEQIQSVEMVKHQLSHCNMAVINKADLVSPELLSALQANIRRINPDCEIASCSFGGFNLVLLEHEMQSVAAEEEECTKDAPTPDSIVLSCTHRLEKQKVIQFIEHFVPDTYRIKGFCLFETGWNQIDVVGSHINFTPCMPHSSSRLIFISKIGHALSDALSEYWDQVFDLPMQLHD